MQLFSDNFEQVVFVPFSNGKPSGMAQDVVTGFLNSDDQARGRPVGLAVDKAGGLLIADEFGNTIRRATSSGSGPSPAARLWSASVEQQLVPINIG